MKVRKRERTGLREFGEWCERLRLVGSSWEKMYCEKVGCKWDENLKVGGKVGQIDRNRVVKEWGERVKWEGDLRVGRMW